jgi:hypothetical protein
MSITPTVLIAGSGLLNNQALDINPGYRSDITSVADASDTNIFHALHKFSQLWPSIASNYQASITNLIKNHPVLLHGTDTGLSSDLSVFSMLGNVRSAQLNFSPSSIPNFSRRVNYMLQQFAPLVHTAEASYAGIHYFKDMSWDDISLDAKTHEDLANNGILRVLLTGNDDQIDNIKLIRQQLRPGETLNDIAGRRLALLSKALRNLGTLFDPADLANMGKAQTLIENMYSLGLSRLGDLNQLVLELEVSDLSLVRDMYLKELLAKITGKAVSEIIERTGVKLPNPTSVKTLADLLDPKNLFTADVINELPASTLVGLAGALDKIGGRYETLADVANMLDTVEIPDLTLLSDQPTPLPQSDIDLYLTKFGTGTGLHNNPTLTDFFWWLTGQGEFKQLVHTLENLRSACISSPNQVWFRISQYVQSPVDWEILAVFTMMVADPNIMYWVEQADKAYTKLLAQYQTTVELYSLHTSGTFINFATSGLEDDSDISLSATINNLHTYGVDHSGLGFREFFLGLVSSTRSGEALKSAIQEGRVHYAQTRQGIRPIGVADVDGLRKERASAELDQAIVDLKSIHAKYEAIINRTNANDDIKQHIIDSRRDAINRVKSLGVVAGTNTNPYREIY